MVPLCPNNLWLTVLNRPTVTGTSGFRLEISTPPAAHLSSLNFKRYKKWSNQEKDAIGDYIYGCREQEF